MGTLLHYCFTIALLRSTPKRHWCMEILPMYHIWKKKERGKRREREAAKEINRYMHTETERKHMKILKCHRKVRQTSQLLSIAYTCKSTIVPQGQWTECWALNLVINFVWRDKQFGARVYIDLWAVVNSLVCWSEMNSGKSKMDTWGQSPRKQPYG